MSNRRVYHVVPGSETPWQIEEEGADQPSSRHRTKEEAVARAREMGRSLPLAQVIVHKQDGTIQTEYTYGDDPNPPAG